MGLLNYTTKIPADQSAAEVQTILGKHGARQVMIDYGLSGTPEALSFLVYRGETRLAFRVPCRPGEVLKVLERQHRAGQLRRNQGRPTPQQALRVSWRITKDWVEAQMAILDTEMVTMEEVFLPYLLDDAGQTLYQVLQGRSFLLPPGRD